MATYDVFGRVRQPSFTEEQFHKDLTTFGRPGYGAPRRTGSGRLLTNLKLDPHIRYNMKSEYGFLERYERRKRDQQYEEAAQRKAPPNTPVHPSRKKHASSAVQTEKIPPLVNPSAVQTEKIPPLLVNPHNELIERDTTSDRPVTTQTMAFPRSVSSSDGFEPEQSEDKASRSSSRGSASMEDLTRLPSFSDLQKNSKYIYHRPNLEEKLGLVDLTMKSPLGVSKYRDALRRHIEAVEERKRRDRENSKEAGQDVATVIIHSAVGRPRRDPETGDILPRHLTSTDVTRIRSPNASKGEGYGFFQKDRKSYRLTLEEQLHQRLEAEKYRRQDDVEKYRQHCQTWSSFWGRPGCGAPNGNTTHLAGLHKMLVKDNQMYD